MARLLVVVLYRWQKNGTCNLVKFPLLNVISNGVQKRSGFLLVDSIWCCFHVVGGTVTVQGCSGKTFQVRTCQKCPFVSGDAEEKENKFSVLTHFEQSANNGKLFEEKLNHV